LVVVRFRFGLFEIVYSVTVSCSCVWDNHHLSLYRFIALSLYRFIALSLYRFIALSLYRFIALS
jgi:hypothetical protein